LFDRTTDTSTNWLGFGKGNGLSVTELIRLKTAVFEPIPNPITKTAVTENPGDFASSRIVCRTDWKKPSINVGGAQDITESSSPHARADNHFQLRGLTQKTWNFRRLKFSF
jgi:hypothetical protein